MFASTPARSAKWKVSARPVTIVMRKVFTASFIDSAAGIAPHRNTCPHMAATTGSTWATASASPASIPTSVPSIAGPRDPETGAST